MPVRRLLFAKMLLQTPVKMAAARRGSDPFLRAALAAAAAWRGLQSVPLLRQRSHLSEAAGGEREVYVRIKAKGLLQKKRLLGISNAERWRCQCAPRLSRIGDTTSALQMAARRGSNPEQSPLSYHSCELGANTPSDMKGV